MAPTLATSCAALPLEGAEARGSKLACARLDGLKRLLRLAAPCLAPWSGPAALKPCARDGGFTLLELMVVVSIIAMASAGVGFALRDSSQTQLEREAQRLAALFESARARSRASGVAVRWHTTAQGFRFDGLPPKALPERWLSAGTAVRGPITLLLGPEPIIGPQDIALSSTDQPGRVLHVITDGLRPFSVQP